jgi:transposase
MGKLFDRTKRRRLIKQHQSERDGRVRDRIKAVLMVDNDYSYTETSKALLVDDETVRRHVEDYLAAEKLAPENGGSDTKLDETATEALSAHLNDVTYLYVNEICTYVEATYGIVYTVSGMTKWLKSQGFRYKKPHGVPAKADAEKQAAFREYYNHLKASLTDEDVLYFVDGSHPQHQTQLAYGWIAKGVRKAVKMTACQKRVNLLGAIELKNHQVEYRHVDWVNFESISAFFTQLIDVNPTRKNIHIILDNAGYHRSEKMREFVEQTNITLHFLPPYSPNLNPIERLWKILHEQVTYNRYYPKFSDFTEGIIGFFDKIQNYRHIIQSRINDNFQSLSTV